MLYSTLNAIAKLQNLAQDCTAALCSPRLIGSCSECRCNARSDYNIDSHVHASVTTHMLALAHSGHTYNMHVFANLHVGCYLFVCVCIIAHVDGLAESVV